MTVFEVFEKTVGVYGDRPFLHIPAQAAAGYSDHAIDLTYQESHKAVTGLINLYQQAGYGEGHRIVMILDNRAEFFLHFLALNALGVCVVPLNSEFQPQEMAYLIEHSDACLVISLPVYLEKAETALNLMKRDVPLISVEQLDLLPDAASVTMEHKPEGSTEAALLYTSGTTGKPKGCILTNDYFLIMADWYLNLGGYCKFEPGKERLITPLPLVHMNALCASAMAMIMTGGCIIQLDRFHASSWWATVRESQATCLHYLGVMPAILLKQTPVPGDDFSDQIKFGLGAGVDPKHQQAFEQRFGFPLIEGWSMTEVGGAAVISAQSEPRHLGQRCFGKPMPGMEYRIVDEQGQDVATGEPGELLVRAAGDEPRKGFFAGYYKDIEATEQAWKDGWFHSGDVVRIDEEGSFYFVDRRKNIIRRSGENIAAVEVEAVLYQSPLLVHCAVVPVEDEIRGEEVAACIIAEDNVAATRETAESIFAFCREHLSYYKVPAYYLFMEKLPMTASQKIQRGELKKQCNELVKSGECIDLRDYKRSRK